MNTGQILDALGRGTITPTEATRLMQEADRLIQHARSVVARAAQVLPPADPEADAATDRFLAQVYAAEGRRPLTRRGPA